MKEHDVVNTPKGRGTIVHIYPSKMQCEVEINNETHPFPMSELEEVEIKDEVEIVNCPCCGASMKKHWHRLSPGLANTLIKFREECIRRGTYRLYISSEVGFTKTEYNNFQKLRYHALVAKAKEDDGKKHIAGLWILTKRGNQFCKNQRAIPNSVQTFRNKITEKSNELVNIYQVMKIKDGNDPYWDTKYDFPYELEEIEDIKYAEGYKADKDGNGLLF